MIGRLGMRVGLVQCFAISLLSMSVVLTLSCDTQDSGSPQGDECQAAEDGSGACEGTDLVDDEETSLGLCGSDAAETTLKVTVETLLTPTPEATLTLRTYFVKPASQGRGAVADGPNASFDQPTFPVVYSFSLPQHDQVWVAAVYADNTTGEMLARDITDAPVPLVEGKVSCLTITLK